LSVASFIAAIGEPTVAIYEVGLDGSERMVRDLTTQFAGFTGGTWVSDSFLALASRDTRILVPVDGSTTRTLPGPGFGQNRRSGLAYVSTDGERVLIRSGRDGEINATSLTVMTTTGEVVRTIDLPIDATSSAWQVPIFRGDAAVVMAAEKGRATTPTYLVPLDGRPARLVATLPGRLANEYQCHLSPDGSTLALTLVDGPRTATILDLDLTRTLRRTKS